MRLVARVLLAIGAVAASVMVIERLYRLRLRAWVLTAGATADEAAQRMPGDELLEAADIVATRAILIDAPVGDLALVGPDGPGPGRCVHL